MDQLRSQERDKLFINMKAASIISLRSVFKPRLLYTSAAPSRAVAKSLLRVSVVLPLCCIRLRSGRLPQVLHIKIMSTKVHPANDSWKNNEHRAYATPHLCLWTFQIQKLGAWWWWWWRTDAFSHLNLQRKLQVFQRICSRRQKSAEFWHMFINSVLGSEGKPPLGWC